jgi:hypothetical protein
MESSTHASDRKSGTNKGCAHCCSHPSLHCGAMSQVGTQAINKIIKAFLWKGRREVKGGHCLVGWERVCQPPDLGGLGILNLETLSCVLHMRWLWLRKTQPDRPWTELNIQVHPNVSAMFSSLVISVVGDETTTYFWTDRWLHG